MPVMKLRENDDEDWTDDGDYILEYWQSEIEALKENCFLFGWGFGAISGVAATFLILWIMK